MGLCLSCKAAAAPITEKRRSAKLCGGANSAQLLTASDSTGSLNGKRHRGGVTLHHQNPPSHRRCRREREEVVVVVEEGEKNAVLTTSTMANFNNMMFSNSIKGLISKKRNRYKKDGFDLDLTYIRHNIIAMGYPASNIEGKVIRNHIDDVVKLLDSKHKDHYKIYNLCSERSYDATKFHNRVKMFPFDDHNPPKIDLIRPFCVDVHEWLNANAENVAAVHCKAGKGRTGTMICCYLLHSQIYKTADDALSFYGNTRTQDKKGVTIPSQVRYIRYYESMIREHLVYSSVSLYVTELKLEPPPTLTSAQGGSLYFTISSANFKKKCKSIVQEVRKGDVKCLTLRVDACVPITGDIKIELYSKSPLKKKQFQFWFNTFFVRDEWSGQTTTTACCASPVASSDLNGYSGQNGGGGGAATTTTNVGILQSPPPLSNNCSSSTSSSNTGETLVLTLTKSELDNLNKKDKQNKTFSADFKIMLLLRRPSKNIWMPAQQEGIGGQHVIQDSPSGSSEGDSSDGDDDDEAWDSVAESDSMMDPRGVGYRLLSECELASQLTGGGGGAGGGGGGGGEPTQQQHLLAA